MMISTVPSGVYRRQRIRVAIGQVVMIAAFGAAGLAIIYAIVAMMIWAFRL